MPSVPSARPPLLIVQIGPPEPLDRGAAVYRTIQPCRALGELPDVTVVSGSILSPALFAPGPSPASTPEARRHRQRPACCWPPTCW